MEVNTDRMLSDITTNNVNVSVFTLEIIIEDSEKPIKSQYINTMNTI